MRGSNGRASVMGVVAIVAIAGTAYAGGPAVGHAPGRFVDPTPPAQTPPQPTAQPGGRPPPTPPPTPTPTTSTPAGTTPVNVGGQTMNVTPDQAAVLKAWQDRLRDIAAARGMLPTVRHLDVPMTTYIVPTGGGSSPASVTIPSGIALGAWLSSGQPAPGAGGTTPPPVTAAPADVPAQPGPPPPARLENAVTKLASPVEPPAPVAPTALTTTPKSDASLRDARSRFTPETGWQEIALANGDVVFMQTSAWTGPAVGMKIDMQLSSPGGPPPAPAYEYDFSVAPTVRDYANEIRRHYDRCEQIRCGRAGLIIGRDEGGNGSFDTLGRSMEALKAADPAKFTLRDDTLEAQMALLEASKARVRDGGQIDRALALSEMSRKATWRMGVSRLGRTAMANPPLIAMSLADDFEGVTADDLRGLVRKAVEQATQSKAAVDWVGVAALMAMEGRHADAARMLDRAAKATKGEGQRAAIEAVRAKLDASRPKS